MVPLSDTYLALISLPVPGTLCLGTLNHLYDVMAIEILATLIQGEMATISAVAIVMSRSLY